MNLQKTSNAEPEAFAEASDSQADANKKTYNILLIGETGVGKSTFINAFFYYMTYETLNDALKAKDIKALVPTRFTVLDDDYNEQHIVYGDDKNESSIPGASATLSPRSYKFSVGNAVVRLIDTPGVGDTKGMQMDETNFDRLLTVIGELKDIHAICIMLKPNNSRLTVLFEYCVKQLLSRLQRSASQNIVFLFTNSRATLYRPGDTVVPLRKILRGIAERRPYVDIPFNKNNIFCIDNEAFRFLVAHKFGVNFSDGEKDDFAASWNKSAKVCLSLLSHAIQSKPHKIQDTVSINEARRLILRLSRPLAEITDNIDKNLDIIKRHKTELDDSGKNIELLKKKLYVPVLRIKAIDLGYPRTVCTDPSCVDIIWIHDRTKTYKYRTICHKRCYVDNVDPKLVGDPGLINCEAISNKFCIHCKHSYLVHMHITYETETYEEKIKDTVVVSDIQTTESRIKELKNLVKKLEERKSKYQNERDVIQKSMAKFAHFLSNNAIALYNDKYKEYLDFLIDRENSYGPDRNKDAIARYNQLAQTYNEEKRILDDILLKEKLADDDIIAAVSADEVMTTLKELYNLELTGPTIKDFYDAQRDVLKRKVLTNTELTYTPPQTMVQKLRSYMSFVKSMIF